MDCRGWQCYCQTSCWRKIGVVRWNNWVVFLFSEFVKNADMMWKQSVWTSGISAAVAAKHLKEGGLITLPGAAPAVEGTAGENLKTMYYTEHKKTIVFLIIYWFIFNCCLGRHGCDHILVGFTTTYGASNQCLSPLQLWVGIPIMVRCTWYYVINFDLRLVIVFFRVLPVSSTDKADRLPTIY